MLHLTYSRKGEKSGIILIFLQNILCRGYLLELPCQGDFNRYSYSQHTILWTVIETKILIIWSTEKASS